MSDVDSTRVAPWRSKAWQPRDKGERIEPGTAMISLPCSKAHWALMSDPEPAPASITTTPADKAVTKRLRMGK